MTNELYSRRGDLASPSLPGIRRWMQEILHHFGFPKYCSYWGVYGIKGGARFPPSAVDHRPQCQGCIVREGYLQRPGGGVLQIWFGSCKKGRQKGSTGVHRGSIGT